MRKALFVLVLAVLLSAFGWSVLQKERQLQNGTVMILALRPVDPRSLMQGDYMVLRFAMEREIDHALSTQMGQRDEGAIPNPESTDQESPPEQAERPHKAIVRLDPSGEAIFVELDSGRPLAEGERLLTFHRRSDEDIRIGAGTFLFQEGHGKAYGRAKYAEMRVDSLGRSLITHLLDENKKRIDPRETEEPRI